MQGYIDAEHSETGGLSKTCRREEEPREGAIREIKAGNVRMPPLDRAASTHYVCSMQIELTPEQQDFVRQAGESGRFARAEDAVQAALTLWVERERRRAEILAAIDAARASIARGEGIEMTEESMRVLAGEIKQHGRAQFATENQSDK
jgi:Arc/MetJ-type ribon-helix-helix transcriptional regulator